MDCLLVWICPVIDEEMDASKTNAEIRVLRAVGVTSAFENKIVEFMAQQRITYCFSVYPFSGHISRYKLGRMCID